MIYLAFFALAVALGWGATLAWGGRTERESMCLLTCVWLATVAANISTGYSSPYIMYALIDGFAMAFLYRHQRRNWQWLLQGLFTGMMTVHLVYLTGTSSGMIAENGRPYQDFLAVLAYAQLFALGWASWQRKEQRHGRLAALGRWALDTDWVPSGSLVHRRHAEP